MMKPKILDEEAEDNDEEAKVIDEEKEYTGLDAVCTDGYELVMTMTMILFIVLTTVIL